MQREGKKLFIEIHEEYELQGSTIRGETPYSQALLDLQRYFLSHPKALAEVRIEFEELKQKFISTA